MGDGFSELQQRAEGQGGDVGSSPAVCLLVYLLLKLDPSSRLPPLQLLVPVDHQLVQLHKHLDKQRNTTFLHSSSEPSVKSNVWSLFRTNRHCPHSHGLLLGQKSLKG